MQIVLTVIVCIKVFVVTATRATWPADFLLLALLLVCCFFCCWSAVGVQLLLLLFAAAAAAAGVLLVCWCVIVLLVCWKHAYGSRRVYIHSLLGIVLVNRSLPLALYSLIQLWPAFIFHYFLYFAHMPQCLLLSLGAGRLLTQTFYHRSPGDKRKN